MTPGPADRVKIIFSIEEKMILRKLLQIPAFNSNL